MRTMPFSADQQKVQGLNPDVIVECYLDAKYYHYDPVVLADLPENHANFAHLLNSGNVVTGMRLQGTT